MYTQQLEITHNALRVITRVSPEAESSINLF